MDTEGAYNAVCKSNREKKVFDFSKFISYSNASSQLGAGDIVSPVRCPLWNHDTCVYDTYQTTALVLSHECDIDQDNKRPYSDMALVVPVVPLGDVVEELNSVYEGEKVASFMANLGLNDVSRVMYLPIQNDEIPFGAIIYLNQICSTPVSWINDNSEFVAKTTSIGLRAIDYKMENHLRRPKDLALPLSGVVRK